MCLKNTIVDFHTYDAPPPPPYRSVNFIKDLLFIYFICLIIRLRSEVYVSIKLRPYIDPQDSEINLLAGVRVLDCFSDSPWSLR